MIPVTVVVAFYSRCGSSETRALTAAVGAVQARALIRMRRMADVDGASHPAECADELARMRKEYVPPTGADILGADGLLVAAPGGSAPASAEWAPLSALLSALRAEGQLRGKVAGVVDGGDPSTVGAFATLLHDHGFVVVPPAGVDGPDAGGTVERARAHGRLVASVCRALKAAAL
jgi:hypothetical protein